MKFSEFRTISFRVNQMHTKWINMLSLDSNPGTQNMSITHWKHGSLIIGIHF